MDGLLVDTEPLWNQAAAEIFNEYNILLTPQQYSTTTGLRTKEFVQSWFSFFNVPPATAVKAAQDIIDRVIALTISKGKAMPGVEHIFNLFINKGFKIGLASSSPMSLIDVVVDLLQIRSHLNSITSAATLQYGKPHPEVYLIAATELQALPAQCICFEDSFPGMIAAKAAAMKCVVVPDPGSSKDLKWHAADLKISSLVNFNELLLYSL
jgi:sugar-phosphatase